jgi:hypothetical protein
MPVGDAYLREMYVYERYAYRRRMPVSDVCLQRRVLVTDACL